jgi:uncharacterized membrane protein YccC
MLFSAAELARMVGVSDSTISNWTKLDRRPLQKVVTSDGYVRFTWSHLEEFCRAHPGLRGVAKMRQHPSRSEPPPDQVDGSSLQIEELKSSLRDMRNAADASLQAAIEASRQAEEAARSHRRQLEHLATMVKAYDSAFAQITAPKTIND